MYLAGVVVEIAVEVTVDSCGGSDLSESLLFLEVVVCRLCVEVVANVECRGTCGRGHRGYCRSSDARGS